MTSRIDEFVESQGSKIHYLTVNSNENKQACLLFVPGVMMPAWIWENQLDYFSKNYRVAAMDPRSQETQNNPPRAIMPFRWPKILKLLWTNSN